MAKEIVRPEAATAPAVPNDGEESDSQATTAWPRRNGDINAWTDHYFNRTQDVVGRFGDRKVTYALFLRRPCVSAPRLAIAWLEGVAAERGIGFDIDLRYEESRWVGAGEPLIYVTGSLYHLVDLETLLLQKLGPACVAAYNAYTMCADLPKVAFLAMDARHCAGTEMAEMMAYAASVGSARAGRKVSAVGFVGNATDATAHFFGNEGGMGTMPHALVGYAGSTVAHDRASRLLRPGGERLPGRLPPLPGALRGGHAFDADRHAGRAVCSSVTCPRRSAATATKLNCGI
jgi:nicotinate phosphoribosyltransferase